MDSLYNLAVRLELSAGGMMQAAEGVIATFGRMEASAGRMERVVRGMRLTLDTQGLQAGAMEAMGVFRNLELQSGKTGEHFRAMNLSGSMAPLLSDYRAATTELGNMETAAASAERRATALSQSLTRAAYVSQAGMPGAPTPGGGVFADNATNRAFAYNQAAFVAADAEANALRHTQLPAAHVAEANAGYALQTHLQTQNAALEEHAAAQERTAQRAQGLLMGGAVMAGAGFMGLGVIKSWVKDAEGMQDALAKVSLATTGTSAQLAALQSQSYTVAGQTQYSAPQIMDMEAKMGRMGINRRDWVAQDIPTIARAAEIDQRMAGIAPEASIPAMISQAHMLGATHGKAFIDNIALGTRALLASGMTPEEQNTTLKYLLPVHNATGMSNADMFQWASLSNLMGLSQGKGGSYLGAMFAKLVPGVGTHKHLEALAKIDKLGGGHLYEHGNLVSSDKVQEIISRALAAEPTDAARQTLAYDAFGVQGERAAFALTSPAAMASSDMLRHKLAPYDPVKNPTGIASVEEMQLKLNQTMVGQTNTLNTNLHSISSMLGGELVPALTKAVSALVQLTGGMIAFGQQHPVFIKIAAAATVAATAMTLIGAPILIAAAAMMVLDGALLPIIGTVAVVGAGIAAVVLIITHWQQVMSALGAVAGVIGSGLLAAFSPLLPVMTSLGDIFGPSFRDALEAAKQFFGPMGEMAHAAIVQIGHLLDLLHITHAPPTHIVPPAVLPPLVTWNHTEPRLHGPIVTAHPAGTAGMIPSTVLGGSSTVSAGSPSLGFKPFVAVPPAAHPPAHRGRGGTSGRGGGFGAVVNMHPGAVTINLGAGASDHPGVVKKVAAHIAATLHTELEAAMDNAQGQSLAMNAYYA